MTTQQQAREEFDKQVAEIAEFEKMCEAQHQFTCNLGAFFQALAMIVSQEVDIFAPEMDMEHYELWLRANGMYQDWLKIIPIGNEYCWTHKPGGWCCPQCYYAERYSS